MINWSLRKLIDIADVLKDKGNTLSMAGMKKISPPGGISFDDEPVMNEFDRNNPDYWLKMAKELEAEINKASFTLGLNESVNSIHE